ncbi:hypothetical protein IID24_03060 [Patescibacteria group bacterium]|nr:hypothetical protein [Patescibacteria group bacterium]
MGDVERIAELEAQLAAEKKFIATLVKAARTYIKDQNTRVTATLEKVRGILNEHGLN